MENNFEDKTTYIIEVGNYRVLVNGNFYKAYKSMDYHDQYLERKYRAWTVTYDCDILLDSKPHFIDEIIADYEIKEFVSKLDVINKKITLGLLDGYNEFEIARALGVDRSTIKRRRDTLKKILIEEILRKKKN